MVCISHSTFFGLSYQEQWHVWETEEVHAEFWWGDLRGKREVGKHRRRSEGNIKNRYLRNGMKRHGLD